MTTAQLSLIATATSVLATLALQYAGIPAQIQCTIGYLMHSTTYALTAPLE